MLLSVCKLALWLHLALLSQVEAGMVCVEVSGGQAGLLLSADAGDGAANSVLQDWGSAPASD